MLHVQSFAARDLDHVLGSVDTDRPHTQLFERREQHPVVAAELDDQVIRVF